MCESLWFLKRDRGIVTTEFVTHKNDSNDILSSCGNKDVWALLTLPGPTLLKYFGGPADVESAHPMNS